MTMNTDEMRAFLARKGPALLEEIKANAAKLNACPKHQFEAAPLPYKMGHKFTCRNCGGKMEAIGAMYYARGYAAAGKNPNEIIPEFFPES